MPSYGCKDNRLLLMLLLLLFLLLFIIEELNLSETCKCYAIHGSGDSSYTSFPGSSSKVTLASSASNCGTNVSSYNKEICIQDYSTPKHGGECDRYGEVLTHFISMTENTLPVMKMRRGTVRVRTKGRAREKSLIFTTHRTARHKTWIRVNRCIRIVFTCTKEVRRTVDM